jgi:hypothetical protein
MGSVGSSGIFALMLNDGDYSAKSVKRTSDNGCDKEAHKRQLLRSVGWGGNGKMAPLNQPQPQPWFSRTNARGGLTTWACGTRGSHRQPSNLAMRRQCPKIRVCNSRSFLPRDREQRRTPRNAHCFTKCVLDRILIM